MTTTDGRVVTLSPATDNSNPQSFVAMSSEMENELERRRKEWEKEVEQMSEEFFQVKVNNQNNLKSNVNKTLDIQLPISGINGTRYSGVGEITEIGNAKTLYEDNPNGGQIIKFEFDMQGFDPRAISVKAQGNRILVTAKVEMEVGPGNKRTRQFTRQVDIPTNVDAEQLVSKLSHDGVLSIEAPYTAPQTPSIDPPAYPGLENDDVYFVTRSSPQEHNRFQLHQSSPFATDRYNLHSNVIEATPPSSRVERVVTTNTYRSPEPVKVSRYYSNYKDPGPLLPHSRGVKLRNESHKDNMHHPTVERAPSPVFYRHSPTVTTTTYRENGNNSTPYPSNKTSSLSVNTNFRDLSPRSPTINSFHSKSKPKVQIIREYDTSMNGETVTQMSPPVRTSIFREYDSSPTPQSPLYRERHESTSSGERIITPTKYKKQMSMSQSSDSENSSLSTSPPAREINPRQLFANTNTSPPVREITPRHIFTSNSVSPPAREINSRQVFSSISSSPPFTDMSPREFFPNTNKNITMNGFDSPNTKSTHPNIITTEEGQRLKMHIDIGKNFNAEEITVHLRFKKVAIRAVHEEIIGGRTSRSEFSREFDLPAPLEPSTVKAALSGNGKLFVGGSLATNLYHNKVLDLVLCDMPTNGRACTVKL